MSDETKPLDFPADNETPAEQATLVGEPSTDETPAAEGTDAPLEPDASGPFDAPSPAVLDGATPPSETEGEQPAAPDVEAEPEAEAFDFSAADEGSDEAGDEASDEQQGEPVEPDADAQGEDAPEGGAETDGEAEQALPAIEPQPTLEEAAAQHPLSAQVVDESMPAHDAVPAEAAADLAKLRLSNDFQGTQQDDPAPLPAGAPQAGTMEDATGISGDTVSPQVASGMAEAKPADEALHDVLSDEPKADEGEGDEAEASEGEDGESEGADEAVSDEADAGDSEADAEAEGEDEGGEAIFGDAQMKHMELADIVGDGLDHVRESAECAHKAQMTMLQTPMSVLSLEHKDLMQRMRSVLSEVIHLADAIFDRN